MQTGNLAIGISQRNEILYPLWHITFMDWTFYSLELELIFPLEKENQQLSEKTSWLDAFICFSTSSILPYRL